jgi:TPR repeat protein
VDDLLSALITAVVRVIKQRFNAFGWPYERLRCLPWRAGAWFGFRGEIMKIMFVFLVTALAAFCCLTRAGNGPAQGEHLTNAADQGNPDMQYEVNRNNANAVRWIPKAAEQGDARAQAELGSIYKDGEGAARDDAVAAAWYQKAADQGLAQAQYDLGLMYAAGRGMDQDFAQAAVWYRKAAEQRLAAAQFYLGYLYLKGRGVEQDPEQAAAWYRKAADQGDGGAQFSLASSYEKGRGVQQDLVQAIEWLILATADGVPEAEQRLERLQHRATRSQIAEAQALASRWQRRAARAAGPISPREQDPWMVVFGAP